VIAGIWIGIRIAAQIPLDEDVVQFIESARRGEALAAIADMHWVNGTLFAGLIWVNNLKSVALVTLLGIFTFGVGGVLGLMVTLATLGILLGLVIQAGYSPWLVGAAYFLPHGIFEIPAIMLAGATILRLGAVLVTPAKSGTIGQAWIRALADWVKVTLAVVVPIFLIAALVEAFITPRVALWILGQ
jgi:stage II sporulation protein M